MHGGKGCEQREKSNPRPSKSPEHSALPPKMMQSARGKRHALPKNDARLPKKVRCPPQNCCALQEKMFPPPKKRGTSPKRPCRI